MFPLESRYGKVFQALAIKLPFPLHVFYMKLELAPSKKSFLIWHGNYDILVLKFLN